MAAIGIAVTCVYVGKPLEPVLLTTAACAAVLAEIAAVSVSPYTATGVVLTIAAAPLIAYGMQPRRRPTLLQAALLLIIANTAFMLGAGATTLEWFTLPPAVILLAVGIVRLAQPTQLGLPRPRPDARPGPLRPGCQQPPRLAPHHPRGSRRRLLILIAIRYSLQSPFIIGSAASPKSPSGNSWR